MRIWDAANPDRAPFVHKEEYRIHSLALSSDGKMLAHTTDYSQQITLWNVADPQAPRRQVMVRGFAGEVHAVAFFPDRKTLVSTGTDRKLRLLDLSGGTFREQAAVPDHEMGLGGIGGLAASPDGQTFAFHGRLDATVHLWTLADAAPRERLRLPNYPHPPCPIAFAPDGQAFVNANYGPVSYCALTSDKPRSVNLQPQHNVRTVALAFAPDGKTFASAGTNDQTIRLWDVSHGEPKERAIIKFKEAGQHALSLSYASDGKTLAVLGTDRKISVWAVDGVNPQERGVPLADLGTNLAAIGFSPDGKLLATLGSDGKTSLWDWGGSRVALRTSFGGPQAHGGTVTITSLAFSPDSKLIAVSAGGAEAVALYDAISGKRLRAWVFPGAVTAVDFGADSRHLFVGNGNGTVYVLRLAGPVAAGSDSSVPPATR
jgi:WD40 repeat protein